MFVAILVPLSMADTPNFATSAFHKLQVLAGEWGGKDDARNTVKTKFELVAGNTAVMETVNNVRDGTDVDPVYGRRRWNRARSLLPDEQSATHGDIPLSAAVKELIFSFQGATNLPDPSIGHEQKLLLQFTGADQIVEHWTAQERQGYRNNLQLYSQGDVSQ